MDLKDVIVKNKYMYIVYTYIATHHESAFLCGPVPSNTLPIVDERTAKATNKQLKTRKPPIVEKGGYLCMMRLCN